jgi:hypothetical protein
VVVTIKHDGPLGQIKERWGGGLRRIYLLVFVLSLARRELRRATAEDHEEVLYLGEPVVLVVALLGIYCFLLSVVLRLTTPGEVAPHHGALL